MTYLKAVPVNRYNPDALLRDFFTPTPSTPATVWSPEVDIAENESAFLLSVSLPGIAREEVDLRFEDQQLILEGERKKEDGLHYLQQERRYGKFRRAFKIKTDIDLENIKATFQHGILTITLPKAESAKPKTININVK